MSRSFTHRRIYEAVSRIPRGRVATYGQIARLAGLPGQARLVGYALSALPDGSAVPWHRVVNARGEVSPRSGDSPMALVQRLLLKRERVRFDPRGRIPLERYQWKPRSRASVPPWTRSPTASPAP
jgi:methylated-DNA-protein-cysteine methyltransferase-like protein